MILKCISLDLIFWVFFGLWKRWQLLGVLCCHSCVGAAFWQLHDGSVWVFLSEVTAWFVGPARTVKPVSPLPGGDASPVQISERKGVLRST